MSVFDAAELDQLSHLCQIACSSEEKQDLCQHLARLIEYVKQMDAVDTTHVEPCLTVLDTLKNVLNEDVVETTLSREDFLANAPSHIGGMIRTPSVMK